MRKSAKWPLGIQQEPSRGAVWRVQSLRLKYAFSLGTMEVNVSTFRPDCRDGRLLFGATAVPVMVWTMAEAKDGSRA